MHPVIAFLLLVRATDTIPVAHPATLTDTVVVASIATDSAPAIDTVARPLAVGPRLGATVLVVPLAVAPVVAAPGDTVPRRRRPVVIEYSDWYGRRMTIHRIGAWLMLPVFAGQYVAGQQLLEKSSDAPAWARQGHRALATATAGIFGVNSLTGVWNLWEGRHDPAGRKWRTAHSLLMLAADAGFTVTGLLANDAEVSSSTRLLHRNVAEASMGVAGLAMLMMVPPFRRE